MPNIGFTIRHLASFPLGFADSRVILILNPRASASLSVGPTQSTVQDRPLATWVTLAPVRLAYPVCPENEICAAPIGICRRIGRLCWTCFTIVEMSCNRDSESDRVFPLEGISFVARESL